MKIEFEHNYQAKYMEMSFPEPLVIDSHTAVLQWRSRWMEALKTWHSPYKALLNCENLTIDASDPKVADALEAMAKFFKGFFLKKAVAYTAREDSVTGLPFPIEPSRDAAIQTLGIRAQKPALPGDFRSQIQFENHFRTQSVELTFASPVELDSSEKIATLKAKMTNNLMQWHSAWNLIVDCSNVNFAPEQLPEWTTLERYFKGFFLKETVGYGRRKGDGEFPFPMYRARHIAVAKLEAEGHFSGDEADCNSRKQKS